MSLWRITTILDLVVVLLVRETSKRILALCEDKKKLKAEREAAKKLREKIIGVDEKIHDRQREREGERESE